MNTRAIDSGLTIPRKPKPEWTGISYDEYLKVYHEKYPFASVVVNPLSEAEQVLSNRINFTYDTIEKNTDCKTEVIEAWQRYVDVAESETERTIASDIDFCVHALISLTKDAKFSENENAEIMLKLENVIALKLKKTFSSSADFLSAMREWILWQKQHARYLNYLNLNYNYNELHAIRELYQNHLSDFELIKAIAPSDYIDFATICKMIYKSFSSSDRNNFRALYLRLSLQQILVAKNAGYFENYELKLEDYYSEVLVKRGVINWLYKRLTGYGEKPWRLVALFFAINIIFAFMFCFFPRDFSHPDHQPALESLNLATLFLTFLSFNNTTMLTVGYGDMYPIAPLARLLVTLLQLMGFVVSSSAIALFLRKILRF